MGIEDEIGALLRSQKQTLAVAESCTGGMLGQRITSTSGSSDYFRGGIIAYANEVKTKLLGVETAVLTDHGAVSAETACRMALGAMQTLDATVGVSVTGIAGPEGGSPDKPVGLVFIGLADEAGCSSEKFNFKGGRGDVRQQATDMAFTLLKNRLLERN